MNAGQLAGSAMEAMFEVFDLHEHVHVAPRLGVRYTRPWAFGSRPDMAPAIANTLGSAMPTGGCPVDLRKSPLPKNVDPGFEASLDADFRRSKAQTAECRRANALAGPMEIEARSRDAYEAGWLTVNEARRVESQPVGTFITGIIRME